MRAVSSHKLPGGIWALGMVSLFMDIASEMVHGLLPVFLVAVLGASMTTVGLLEGVSEALVLVTKTLSGPLSDHLGRRKRIVVVGYALSAASKLLFALSGSIAGVVVARLADRTGKGIRGAPRDALIADLTRPEVRGRAFGLRQALDTVGAVIGPLAAMGLMVLFLGRYNSVFWVAVIPALASVGTLVLLVREPTSLRARSSGRRSWMDLKEFPAAFWEVVALGALFQLARFSEAFLIVRATDLGLKLSLAPLVLIAMNVVFAVTSYPAGHLSDRVPRIRLLWAGLLLLVGADFLLAFAADLTGVFAGIALWGLHLGLTQGTLAALVADTCPSDRRGAAYGVFNLFSAGALFLASGTAGVLWDRLGPRATFVTGGLFAAASLLLASGYRRPSSSSH